MTGADSRHGTLCAPKVDTAEPQQQMYHYEGTMMDRDLGAVSSTVGTKAHVRCQKES